jgi:hypothetical protein
MTCYSGTLHLARSVWLGSYQGDNRMAMMTAYFDESGDPDNYGVVVSGFAGTVDQWVGFESDWKQAHVDFGLPDPAIHPFHMKDFAHSNKVFKDWKGDEPRRKHFMSRLITIIQVRVEFGFAFMVEMDTYRAVDVLYRLDTIAPMPFAPPAVCGNLKAGRPSAAIRSSMYSRMERGIKENSLISSPGKLTIQFSVG